MPLCRLVLISFFYFTLIFCFSSLLSFLTPFFLFSIFLLIFFTLSFICFICLCFFNLSILCFLFLLFFLLPFSFTSFLSFSLFFFSLPLFFFLFCSSLFTAFLLFFPFLFFTSFIILLFSSLTCLCPAAEGTQQQHLFKQSFSGLTSESHSITTLRGSTHFTLCYCLPSETPDHSCSSQHSCSFQLAPTASSSPLQLPAIPGSLLQRFTDVQRLVPTSGYRFRTNDLCRLSIHRSQIKTRFLSSTTDHLQGIEFRILKKKIIIKRFLFLDKKIMYSADTQQLLRQNLLQIAKGDVIPQLLPVLGVGSSPRGIRTTPRICPGSPPCSPVSGRVASPRSPRRTYSNKSVSISTTSLVSTFLLLSKYVIPS
ncbi:unnamed protein product [Acanthosepion pharaonis]|uniref:Uncharacterized protein n=1 Tax=Acanthosepion pharaonis TaxID=158019 RepID=A0A812BZ29_ACAPH|nr:unnamed protein product [Sepia pharaonis]